MANSSPGTVLITGGSSGLGAAVCRAVAGAGGRPLVIDQVPPAEGIDHELVDLADRSTAEEATRALADRADLDAVVTAAGVDACGKLADILGKEWDRVIAVNLLGTAAVIRAALPYLESRRGRIVTCSSTLGFRALGDATAYCASKFGIVGFSRALAAELSGKVAVTMLVPGGMRTAFFDGRDPQYQPGPDAQLNDPDHVAEAVLFALRQPPGCELREITVCPSQEPSWP